jgi:hypothetical protein
MPDELVFGSDCEGVRMKHAGTRFLYGYWDRLRRDRPAPHRREIEPAEIGRILSDTFILESGDGGECSYRLAGTHICSAYGSELKGTDWFATWATRDREAMATLMHSVVSDAAGAIIQFDGRNMRGQRVPMETLVLPLSHSGAGYRRVLGVTVALDRPYWLGALPIVNSVITDISRIWPDKSRIGGPIPVDDTDTAKTMPLRRLGHLALYDGGRPD